MKKYKEINNLESLTLGEMVIINELIKNDIKFQENIGSMVSGIGKSVAEQQIIILKNILMRTEKIENELFNKWCEKNEK